MSRSAFTSTENGEPLALINDGVLQHMRVGADSGIGAKAMAREDASVVGNASESSRADRLCGTPVAMTITLMAAGASYGKRRYR